MDEKNPNQDANQDANQDTNQDTNQDKKQEKSVAERIITEEFKVSGEAVVAKVKELVREGNIRRITFKNEEGRTLIEIPLTVGVIGTVLLPVWASIGAIAALVANLTIAVERPAEASQKDGEQEGSEQGNSSKVLDEPF